MAVEIQSKKAIVSKAPYELYMGFVDMRNIVHFLPEEKRKGVEADYDSIKAEVQGFNIGVKAASLADLKYDKSQSMYDNLF